MLASSDGVQSTSRTTLCLVRHAESTWNAEGRTQGSANPFLSALGQRQIHVVAARLATEQWDVVYSSDLTRAFETAAAIVAATGLPHRVDVDLRERGQGKLEGYLSAVARQLFSDLRAPEMMRETDAALEERAIRAYHRIRDKHSGQRVIVVAHGALMRSFLRTVVGDVDGLGHRNTACTLMHWQGNRWHVQYMADASHLDAMPDDETVHFVRERSEI